MRTKAFVVFESVFLGLGLLLLTPSANPKAKVNASNPIPVTTTVQKSSLQTSSKSKKAAQKPLAVWVCMTSWYGEDFDGQPTATGETYDMYGATAAHPTLPLGSIVRVVNIRNDRSEIVRINDRGPYIPGREID